MKATINGLNQEIEKYKSESNYWRSKLTESEKKYEQQVSSLMNKKTTNNNAVKEYEDKLEELTEEKEHFRDLLYQEKQSHMLTKEKRKLIS